VSSRNPRVQVCLRPAELETLRGQARAADLSLSAYLRGLCRLAAVERGREVDVRLTALAALVAAEHSLALLEALMPDGVRRSMALREDAVRAAEERLELLRAQLEEQENARA